MPCQVNSSTVDDPWQSIYCTYIKHIKTKHNHNANVTSTTYPPTRYIKQPKKATLIALIASINFPVNIPGTNMAKFREILFTKKGQ
jgi:hypothetical protein